MTATRATRLVLTDGRVSGVELEGPEGTRSVATRSVVIATGGFEYDDYMSRLPARPAHPPGGVPTNTGDGLRMAMRAGAQLGNMREAWWVPAADLPEGVDAMNRFLVNCRAHPAPLDHGQPPGQAVHQRGGQLQRLRRRLPPVRRGRLRLREPALLAGLRPGVRPPLRLLRPRSPRLRSRLAHPGADPVEALAEAARDPGRRARETVERGTSWPTRATTPTSTGATAPTTAGGATRRTTDRATLGPLETAPFYAIELSAATSAPRAARGPTPTAGCSTSTAHDPGALRRRQRDGGPTGMVYGGAGGTLGPAMVFGFRAGRAAARETERIS